MVKAVYLESQRLWVRTPFWPSSFKETECFFHAHAPQTARAGISSPASEEQCHLLYLTILSRFSCPDKPPSSSRWADVVQIYKCFVFVVYIVPLELEGAKLPLYKVAV